jgi:D-beta-D-heptose 7-phosphate kinase/D-beta-D-heptose 1-phosphate adenosyltransferase
MDMSGSGLLGQGSNFEKRFFTDFGEVARRIGALRALDQRIVLTSGTIDLMHIGHMAYLEKAREFGDFLVVGMDSDEKVRARKGPDRPFVSEEERARILAYIRSVDMIVLKPLTEEPKQLLKAVHPDILVVSSRNDHEDGEIEEMQLHCGEIKVLESQAATSTTGRLRQMMLNGAGDLGKKIMAVIEEHLRSDGGRS